MRLLTVANLRWMVRHRAWTPYYLKRYWRFAVFRLRHPEVVLEGFVFLGKNLEIAVRRGHGRLILGKWVHLGDETRLRAHEGTLRIGDKVVFARDVTVNCYLDIEIGASTLIADWTYICDFDHRTDDIGLPIKDQGLVKSPVRIGPDCWLATKVTVVRGADIGRGTVVGANSVARGNIPEYSIAAGVPAVVVKDRIAWYAADAERRAYLETVARGNAEALERLRSGVPAPSAGPAATSAAYGVPPASTGATSGRPGGSAEETGATPDGNRAGSGGAGTASVGTGAVSGDAGGIVVGNGVVSGGARTASAGIGAVSGTDGIVIGNSMVSSGAGSAAVGNDPMSGGAGGIVVGNGAASGGVGSEPVGYDRVPGRAGSAPVGDDLMSGGASRVPGGEERVSVGSTKDRTHDSREFLPSRDATYGIDSSAKGDTAERGEGSGYGHGDRRAAEAESRRGWVDLDRSGDPRQ